MSHFVFKARKSNGETYWNSRDAADRFEFYRLIRESGDELIEFKEKSQKGFSFEALAHISFGRIKTIEKINLARNLGSMLAAGLALVRALSVLERQTKNKMLKKVISGIMDEIDRGVVFADALKKYPKIFPPIFVAMVHAGEQSGTLSDSLKVVASQMDSLYSLERRIRGAMMYPAVIIMAMIIVAILMFAIVVPTLLKIFVELKVQLPLSTRIILYISNAVQNYGLLILLGALIFGGLLFWAARQEWGRRFLHYAYLKFPIIGPLVREVNAARTARTMSSLLSSGVDIVESVSITASVVQNVHFKDILKTAELAVKNGEPMSKTFNAHGQLYPAFFAEMLSVGEETGKTGDMLLNVAHYYEDDVDQKTKDMSTIIEPFLILTIGAAVGFFAVSMIQPIYSLVNAV
jgi:type IV pilus assembly protein PilC